MLIYANLFVDVPLKRINEDIESLLLPVSCMTKMHQRMIDLVTVLSSTLHADPLK